MKHILKKTILFLLTLSIGFSSCKKETDSPDETDNPTVPITGNSITTSIGGQIIDENGNAVIAATVSVGSNSMQSNAQGFFLFENITVNEYKAYVKVEKSGFFVGSRSIASKSNTINSIRIKLLSNSIVGNFQSTTGGIVSYSGVSLSFPNNGIKFESGGLYSGTVNVALQFLDPTTPDMIDRMPGDLSGIDNNGDQTALETYGMIAVELTSPSGQKLNVADGKKVEIKIPLSGAYLSDAPATIPLWYFDEVNGTWKEEGLATKVGNEYVGEVSHFTFWNFDWPNPATFISGNLTCNATALAGATVIVKTTSGRMMGATISDNLGNYTLRVPQSVVLEMEVSPAGACNLIPIYSATIGSFTSVSVIPTISSCAGSVNSAIITATLQDCAGNPVTNGVLQIKNGSHTSNFYPNSSGVISGSLVYCSASSVNVIAHDFGNLKSSVPQSVSTGATMNLGTISICSNPTNEFINYNLDGTAYSMLNAPGDSLNIYSYVSSNSTQISCFSASTMDAIFMDFVGRSVGTYNLAGINCQNLRANGTGVAMTINISAYGTTIGSFISGSFSGTFVDISASTTHNLTGNFNLKRNN